MIGDQDIEMAERSPDFTHHQPGGVGLGEVGFEMRDVASFLPQLRD